MVDVYLLFGERKKILRPNYSYNFSKNVFVNPKVVYVFGHKVGDECVFYGWLLGDKLKKSLIFHPEGEKIRFWKYGEEKIRINTWEHYSIKISQLYCLPRYNPQKKLTDY